MCRLCAFRSVIRKRECRTAVCLSRLRVRVRLASATQRFGAMRGGAWSGLVRMCCAPRQARPTGGTAPCSGQNNGWARDKSRGHRLWDPVLVLCYVCATCIPPTQCARVCHTEYSYMRGKRGVSVHMRQHELARFSSIVTLQLLLAGWGCCRQLGYYLWAKRSPAGGQRSARLT